MSHLVCVVWVWRVNYVHANMLVNRLGHWWAEMAWWSHLGVRTSQSSNQEPHVPLFFHRVEPCSIRAAAATQRQPSAREIMSVSLVARNVLLLLACAPWVGSQVVINEVSDKGIPGFCSGDDWVEVANIGTDGLTYNLSQWMLCDTDGCADDDAYTFEDHVLLAPSQYLAVCHLPPKNRTHRRWIGSGDNITLYDSTGAEVDSTGSLGGSGEVGKTWARAPDLTGNFSYTWNPTPSAPYAGPGSDCERLARDGLNCSACVDPAVDLVGTCTSTAESDFEAEKLALFGSNDPPSLWNETSFLFRDDTVREAELVLSSQCIYTWPHTHTHAYTRCGKRSSCCRRNARLHAHMRAHAHAHARPCLSMHA